MFRHIRIALSAALLILAFAVPSQAAAYVHIDACQASLRGGGGSDDDIHAMGVRTGASSWGGYGAIWRTSSTSVYMNVKFNYPGGIQRQYLGHCWSYDFGPDSIG